MSEKKRWIFQDIKEIEDKVLYAGDYHRNKKVWEENWNNYVAALREKVSPEIYTMYELWKCDMDVWLSRICMNVQIIYPEVSRETIKKWLLENMEEHHCMFE